MNGPPTASVSRRGMGPSAPLELRRPLAYPCGLPRLMTRPAGEGLSMQSRFWRFRALPVAAALLLLQGMARPALALETASEVLSEVLAEISRENPPEPLPETSDEATGTVRQGDARRVARPATPETSPADTAPPATPSASRGGDSRSASNTADTVNPDPAKAAPEPLPVPPAASVAEKPLFVLPEMPPVQVMLDDPPPETRKAPEIRLKLPEMPPVEVTLPSARSALADALRTALADRKARAKALAQNKAVPPHIEQLSEYYEKHDFAPVWHDETGWNARSAAIVARLARASEDGLATARYAVTLPVEGDAAAIAAADLALSEATLLYARDAGGGRLVPARLSAMLDVRPQLPDAAAVLDAVATAGDAGAALQAFNPPHAGYRALRAKLMAQREASGQDIANASLAVIRPGKLVRLGESDDRVPLLRRRLGLPASQSSVLDAELAEALYRFQQEAGLAATGTLNRATTLALSAGAEPAGPAVSEAEIIANMERWRWLPRDLGPRYLMVNIPEYTLRLVEGDALVHRARVVVGKPDSQTPVFSELMEHLVVNPSWTVPPSILKNEFLPRMAQDPDYAAKRGFQVIHRGDQITIRQPPGERNALGNIKFMFPNRHAVYIHDTPSRGLFSQASRAFSHGCVRVQDPFRLAELVLERRSGWSEGRVRALVGGGERTVRLVEKLPVHMTYFTAFVDEAGQLQSRADIYGHSQRVRSALGFR